MYFEIGGIEKVNAAGAELILLASRAGNWVDIHIVDGVANGISSTGQSLSRGVRRMQTGVTEQYVLVLSLGLLLLLVGFVLVTGVYRI
jgi:NADH-quinone oxidoreductase subunit L